MSLQERILSVISTQMRETSTKETGNSVKRSSRSPRSTCTCGTTSNRVKTRAFSGRYNRRVALKSRGRKANRSSLLCCLAAPGTRSQVFMKPSGFITSSLCSLRCCRMPLKTGLTTGGPRINTPDGPLCCNSRPRSSVSKRHRGRLLA